MPSLRITSEDQLTQHQTEVITAARKTTAQLRRMLTEHDGINLIHELRFDLTAFSPFDSDKPYNLVEAINQSFTALVSFAAASWILRDHELALPMQLNLGPVAGYDIEAAGGSIIAECFAAVTPNNNNKLMADFNRLHEADAEHRYLFFYTVASEFRTPIEDQSIRIVPLTLDQLYRPVIG